MVTSIEIKNITKEVLKESFFNYYSTTQKKTKHLVLDRIFPSQRRVTSYMSGLQTSLGTSFWEILAKRLAVLDGFRLIDNSELKKPNSVPAALDNLITATKSVRESSGGDLSNLRNELNILYPLANNGLFSTITKGKGSDLIIEKNNKIHIYDIKTVQVNANNGNTFNETIILWIAYYKYKSGLNANDINAQLVFPYNSSDELNDATWWNDYGSRVKPLTTNEVSVGNEFWSFITGNPNALSSIIDGITELSEETSFIDFFEEVFNCSNQDELKFFSTKVKVKRVEIKRNVTLNEPIASVTSFNRKYHWKHNNTCPGLIKARVKELLDDIEFTCPECQSII